MRKKDEFRKRKERKRAGRGIFIASCPLVLIFRKYNIQRSLENVTDSASTISMGNKIQKYGKTAARRRINAMKCKDLSVQRTSAKPAFECR